MVSVAGLCTKTCDESKYVVLASRVVEEVMGPMSVATVSPSVANGAVGMPEHVEPAILPLHASHE